MAKEKKKDKGGDDAAVAIEVKPRSMLHVDDDSYVSGLSVGDEVVRLVTMKLVDQSEHAEMGEGEKVRKSQTFEVVNIGEKKERGDMADFAEKAQRSGEGVS